MAHSGKPTGNDVRRMFLDFFISKGHKEVHSSSLVPANDPTLLFTNAGMNQFKDVFLGLEKRDYQRATTSQKCVRAGGKHNDLENVGFTNRHHTFFEMLGNFSFGDYFKKDAVAYAWELVTSPKWYGIDGSKLYATIFKGEGGVPRDDEAYGHWLKVGVPAERIFEMGMKDNFWAMGDTGPCGPCSELHYDMGVKSSDKKEPECAAGECKFPCECGRYVEIWNLVFMQFDRDANGVLNPLPKPSIDTGAGLERVTAVLQKVVSNYDTDLFTPLIKRAAELTVVSSGRDRHMDASLRVIADHARAATFLISDGVIPGPNERSSVLRKIIRRALKHGRYLMTAEPFFYQMADTVAELMGGAYPELLSSLPHVKEVLLQEEKSFGRTLTAGFEALKAEFIELMRPYCEPQSSFRDAILSSELPVSETHARLEILDSLFPAQGRPRGDWQQIRMLCTLLRENGITLTLKGSFAFYLYDSLGFPSDFTQDNCRDLGVSFDQAGYDAAMEAQRGRAKASWKGGSQSTANPVYQGLPTTEFGGYDRDAWLRDTGSVLNWYEDKTGPMLLHRYRDSEVLAITRDGRPLHALEPGDTGEVVLDYTPFYAESGGQVGDVGWFYDDKQIERLAEVTGCMMPVQGVRVHMVKALKQLRVGMRVDAIINVETRLATMRHHTSTHLLHAALRNVLGKHVKQAGSLVDPNHLRFDFSHFGGIEDKKLQEIEEMANREVLRNDRVEVIEDVPIDVAVNEYKAMALFGEKYGDKVRVIRIGDFSTELCGGTHTSATGEIGLIKILKESSVSAGERRLEAVAGEASLRHGQDWQRVAEVAKRHVSTTAKLSDQQIWGDEQTIGETKLDSLALDVALEQEFARRDDEIKRLRKELEQARMKSASSSVATIGERVREIKGVKVLAHRADNLERPQLRTLMDNLRNKIGSGVVVLGSVSDGKVAIIVGVTKDLTGRVQAGKIVGKVAERVGGSGGGRPDMAEAGGKDPHALDAALSASYEVVEELLQSGK